MGIKRGEIVRGKVKKIRISRARKFKAGRRVEMEVTALSEY
jgi:hypothetical protein